MNFRDLTGQKFAMLTAIRRVENSPTQHQARWLFRCDCGNETVAFGANVAHGKQKSCGCYAKSRPHPQLRHGKSNTKAHHIWSGMRQRCGNPTSPAYHYYGERGITVCERWQSFDNFLADMGEPPEGCSLDRIDNNGPYSPENCRWASQSVQCRNTRITVMHTHNGETKPLVDWADQYDLPRKVLWHRYKKVGLRGDDLFKPLRVIARGAARGKGRAPALA